MPEPASTESGCAHGRPARIGWARLLKRVLEIDMEHCPNFGGHLELIAAILVWRSGGEPATHQRTFFQAKVPRGPPRATPETGGIDPGGSEEMPFKNPIPAVERHPTNSGCQGGQARLYLLVTP